MAERGPVSDTVPADPPALLEVGFDTHEIRLHDGTVLHRVEVPGAAADDPITLEQALALLDQATRLVNVTAAGLERTPWVDALHRLSELRATLATLRQIEASIVRHAYLTGEHGKRVIDGLGEVWVGRGRAKERWQSQEAVVAYVEQKIAAQGGEVPGPDQLLEWVAEVVPLTQSTSLRVTPLRSVGLDPEDYRYSEPGTLSVTLPT